MLYAKVVVGLPIEGPFDYSIPQELTSKIKVGARVSVNFAGRKLTGYVVGISKSSSISKVKPIATLLDETPLLDKLNLELAASISSYYCCSLGEAIETILPLGLRKGKLINHQPTVNKSPQAGKAASSLIHDLSGHGRWDNYIKEIKEVIAKRKSVILVLPELSALEKAESLLKNRLPQCRLTIFYRNAPGELENWVRIKNGEYGIVLGLRSAIFAPLPALGLIIVDEEDQPVYKQDQVPHYHARDVAMMRAKIEGCNLILGSSVPSLESMYLVKEDVLGYLVIPRVVSYPQVRVINPRDIPYGQRKKKVIFTKALEDAVYSTLSSQGKVLLFLNRKGFATYAYCSTCNTVFKCPRCNVNLIYHFKEESLRCHYCNYKTALINICPVCNSGYVKLGGTGTEKIESEAARIFPQARISVINDKGDFDSSADIVIATSSVLKHSELTFSLIAVLGIDNSFNRIDFRATERAYSILAGLANLTKDKIIIQSALRNNHALLACTNNDAQYFYKNEMRERKRFNFPPYRHFALVKLRGYSEEKVSLAAEALFKKLNIAPKKEAIKVLSLSAAVQPKLRGNYYWQILLSSKKSLQLGTFLKLNLKDFRHSGIIVTVDIDPS